MSCLPCAHYLDDTNIQSIIWNLIHANSNVNLILASAHDMIIPAKGKAIVPTDLSIALPPSTYGRVAPRSGLAVKHFIDVGAGVVDLDYRGPLGVVLFNFGDQDYKGMYHHALWEFMFNMYYE